MDNRTPWSVHYWTRQWIKTQWIHECDLFGSFPSLLIPFSLTFSVICSQVICLITLIQQCTSPSLWGRSGSFKGLIGIRRWWWWRSHLYKMWRKVVSAILSTNPCPQNLPISLSGLPASWISPVPFLESEKSTFLPKKKKVAKLVKLPCSNCRPGCKIACYITDAHIQTCFTLR